MDKNGSNDCFMSNALCLSLPAAVWEYDCSFWCEGWKSNEMHWNLSGATHTLHILHQNHCLFSAGRICQFSNTFYRWSTTMSEHANDYLSFCMERREKAINLADTHARKKKRPWLGSWKVKSDMSSNWPASRSGWWWYANWSLTSASYKAGCQPGTGAEL